MSDSDDNVNEFDEEIENGHISGSLSPSIDVLSTDSEADVDEDLHAQNEGANFNIDLPTTHKYLGKLNEISGYTLFDDGEIISTIAIHTNTLVFPGFTLPLVMKNHYECRVMLHFTEQRKVFVLLCSDEYLSKLFNYGVMMEIYETDMKNSTLRLKARARQRCQLVPNTEVKNLAGRLEKVTVRILPEYRILSPLSDTQLYNLKSKRKFLCNDYDELRKYRKFRRYHLAQFPLASWIYENYEICYYVKHILEGLSKYYLKEYIPKDPVSLSYWFVQNYLLQHRERLYVMKQKCVIDRLKYEMKCLQIERTIRCNKCTADIAEQGHVFIMSKDGIQSNYCNPNGNVYETVTVSQARNFHLVGLPSKQFSWFPGYAWTIMQCNECRQHLGWKFTAKNLNPKMFYGLAKSNFEVSAKYPTDLSMEVTETD